MALGAYDSNWVSGNAWLGMPMSIGVQLASIVELVADMKDAEKKYGIEGNGKRQKVPSWIQEGFQDRGFAIEQRIKRKDFTRSVSGGDAGGVGEPPIGIVLGDLWKAVSSYGQSCGSLLDANSDNARTDGVDRALPISVQLWTITPTPSRSICRDAANTKHHIRTFVPFSTTFPLTTSIRAYILPCVLRRHARDQHGRPTMGTSDGGAVRAGASLEG